MHPAFVPKFWRILPPAAVKTQYPVNVSLTLFTCFHISIGTPFIEMVLLNKLVVSLWNLGYCFDKCFECFHGRSPRNNGFM